MASPSRTASTPSSARGTHFGGRIILENEDDVIPGTGAALGGRH
ncbi:MAG: hypothetical protein ACR2P2_06385 [Nakamurella sp.]